MSRDTEILEELRKDVGAINTTLAAQHVSLQEHMRRTDQNEASIMALQRELRPIAQHVAVFGALAKIISTLAAAAAIVTALFKFAGK